MSYTKKKYNIAITFLIVMVVMFVALSSLTFIEKSNNDFTGGVDAEENKAPEEVGEYIDEETYIRAPLFTNGWEAFDYANNILMNGKGYKSIQKQSVKGVISLGLSITGYQYINTQTFKNSSTILVCTDTFADMPAGQGDNSIAVSVQCGNNVALRRTPSGRKHFIDSDPVQRYTIEEFYNISGNKLGAHTIAVSKKSAMLSSFSLNKGVYTLSFTLNSNSWKNYEKAMVFAGGTDPSISSIVITYTIDAKTGYFLNMERTDKYQISQKGVRATCTATVKETYTSMNRNFEIALPSFF